jgi:hypothetical protein
MPRSLLSLGMFGMSVGFSLAVNAQQVMPDETLNTVVNSSNQRDFTIVK